MRARRVPPVERRSPIAYATVLASPHLVWPSTARYRTLPTNDPELRTRLRRLVPAAGPTSVTPTSGATTSGAPTSGTPSSGTPSSSTPTSRAPISGRPPHGRPRQGREGASQEKPLVLATRPRRVSILSTVALLP